MDHSPGGRTRNRPRPWIERLQMAAAPVGVEPWAPSALVWRDAAGESPGRMHPMKLTRRAFASAAAIAAMTPVYFAAPMRKDPAVTVAGESCAGGQGRGRYGVSRHSLWRRHAGRLRFEPPKPAAAWKGVRDALVFGPACPQGAGSEKQSEDCLVLKSGRRRWTRAAKKPVLLYIHGGGYSGGSGASPVTDGAELARRGDVGRAYAQPPAQRVRAPVPCASA